MDKINDPDLINDLIEYFDKRADADGDSEGFHPNEEMQLVSRLRLASPTEPLSDGQDELWEEVTKLLYRSIQPVAASQLKSKYTLIKKQ